MSPLFHPKVPLRELLFFTVVFGGFGAGGFNMHRHGMGHKCFGLSYFVCFAIDLRTIGIQSYTV